MPVSKGNSKMKIPGMSTVPGRDCTNCAACIEKCYAMKAFRQYKNVRIAWTKNSDSARANDGTLTGEICEFLARRNPPYFRIHVAGDFMTREYFEEWRKIACAFPLTRFLAFTKAFDIVHGVDVPDNLEIVYSAFPGMNIPCDARRRIAFAGSPGDYSGPMRRRAARAYVCKGRCDDCLQCWHASRDRRDILLPFH